MVGDGVMEVTKECLVVEEDVVQVEEEDMYHPILIPWRATGVGCVAIWPVIVPAPCHGRRHWAIAILALPVEVRSDPGVQAQSEEVEEVGKFGSGASMCCMMRLGINTLWMMRDNCTSHSDSNRLLLTDCLRRKIKMKQKTKKVLC